MGFSSRGDFGPEEVAFTTVLRGDSRRFERTHFACTLVLRFKRLERVETTKTQGLSQGPVRPLKPQITFMFMGGIYSKPTGHKAPCVGALARTDAKGASLKAGKQYSAGSIRVVSCAKDVSPQYQLTEWLQI